MKQGFILEFKGRNHSGTHDQNFLWKSDSAYIMDNHQAALWCWLQHTENGKKYNLFHLDYHYDCLSSQLKQWEDALPHNLQRLTFDEYLFIKYDCDGMMLPVIRYDNYLSIFLKLYEKSIGQCIFATHRKGDAPTWPNKMDVYPFEVPTNFDFWLREGHWIVNIDLDFFFYPIDCAEKFGRLYSDDYLTHFFQEVARKYQDGTISVLTLCLSPETCGGWTPAEELALRICQILDLPFSLTN